MAVKTNMPKPSKRTLMSFLLLLLLAWLILMGWVSSLWCFSGFDTALQSALLLSQKQTQAITGFSGMKIANSVQYWFGKLPTQELSTKAIETGALIKNSLDKVLPEQGNELNYAAEDLFYLAQKVWLLIKLSAQILFIKLAILISAIPLFLLATTTGLVDGLNQRAIRTASLGRESSYVFHQLNRYFKRALLLVLSLWLMLPLSITPAFVFVPVSLLLNIMVSVTASRFKKYV